MSLRVSSRLWITAAGRRPSASLFAAALLCALPSSAQYPGQIANPNKDAATLRAVAVLEWTGDQAHPKTSRLVPICIYDGRDLQDAGIYMARPAPLALESEVEYQLLENGRPSGLFVVDRAGRQLDSWVGFGKWKALPKLKPAPTRIAKIDEDDAQSDVPILHRKHHPGESGPGDSGDSSKSSPPDPDRPTLHKRDSGDSGDSSSGTSSASAPDPDRPTLHKGSASASTADSDATSQKKKKEEDTAYVENVAAPADPNRPHLIRGKPEDFGAPVLPSLIGLPPEMQQAVAVSDAKDRPVHPWSYSWADPADEIKMKTQMEDLARAALGLNPPPAPQPAAKPASKKSSARKSKPAPPPPPEPAPLLDEQFRVFELAYGSGATMVLSARADGDGAAPKFVTLVAQPDLYGNVAVLLKNTTDAAHLDLTPRWRLVDAVDALADNRGELLFELRGVTQRQFALYRVLRGRAARIFLSGVESIGPPASQ